MGQKQSSDITNILVDQNQYLTINQVERLRTLASSNQMNILQDFQRIINENDPSPKTSISMSMLIMATMMDENVPIAERIIETKRGLRQVIDTWLFETYYACD